MSDSRAETFPTFLILEPSFGKLILPPFVSAKVATFLVAFIATFLVGLSVN